MVNERGVEILLEQVKAKSSFVKMFSNAEKSRKLLLIPNRKVCEHLVNVIENLRARYKK